MFLKLFKFSHDRGLLNQTLVRHISLSSSKNMRSMFNFGNVPKNQPSNQRQPKLIFGEKYVISRTLSTRSSHAYGTPRHMASKEENEEFMSLFPVMVSDFIQFCSVTPELSKHLETVLHYNVPNGKKIRGLGLVSAYKMIESPENLNPTNIRLANILGWCAEILNAFFLIFDDIIDQSETRRGTTAWYKVKGVGFRGLGDGIIIENGLYMILQKYFGHHPNYLQILETFHYVTFKTTLGECLDLLYTTDGKANFELFTMKTYKAIAEYKSAYNTVYLPLALAMHLAQKLDKDQHREAKDIFVEIGSHYQIQNDYLDCFGNPESNGKTGNDISEGKCSWLAVVALQKANPEQMKIFKNHYGKRNNKESEQIIRDLYEELELPHIYSIYEEESLNRIRSRIGQLPKELPQAMFYKFANNLYGHQ